MNRAEFQAKIATFGLLLVGVILMVGAFVYGVQAWWAGALAALAMVFPAALAAWGLVLARQQARIVDDEALSAGAAVSGRSSGKGAATGMGGFRMSFGDDAGALAAPTSAREAKALETGFQRVIVALAAVVFLVAAGVIVTLLLSRLRGLAPGQAVPVSSIPLDNLALLIGVGAPAMFLLLYSITRVTRQTRGLGEAINGVLSMGLPGMVMVAAATVGGYFKVAYISEIAASVVAFFLLLQALELIVNALKSYTGIEEFDQDPVDLGALPLVPMVTSNWIAGLRMLLAQSVGIARVGQSDEPGVIARMMPRVLVAALILFIGVNCVAIVHPGEVAIRERLGLATEDDIDHPLRPGMHPKFPWPIDELVRIPIEAVRYAPVGAEETTTTKSGTQLGFRVWTIRHSGGTEEPDFVTGDTPPQLLGGYVGVWWKVKDPEAFYRNLSHSTFLDTARTGGDTEDTERPIYEILVRVIASKGVNRVFATHTAEQILSTECAQVGVEARREIQHDLDGLHAGIEIVNLTIKDVHPPIGIGRKMTASGPSFGPADAYELQIEWHENKLAMIARAQREQHTAISTAESQAADILSEARVQAEQRRTAADVASSRLRAIAPEYVGARREITRQYYLYQMLNDPSAKSTGFSQTVKVILGKGVTPPDLWERSADGSTLPMGTASGPPG